MCIRIGTTIIENNTLTPKRYKLVTRAYVLNVHVFCWANHIHHSSFGGRDINGYHMTWKCHSPRTKEKVKHPLIYWIITRYHEFNLDANIDFNKTCEKIRSYSCEGQVRYRGMHLNRASHALSKNQYVRASNLDTLEANVM